MEKALNRRSFLVGCGLLTFSSAGIFFTGCGKTDNDSDHKGDGKHNDSDKDKDNNKDNDKNHDKNDKSNNDNNNVTIKQKDRTITISSKDLATLKSKYSLEVPSERLLVFYYNNEFYGYSTKCPHQGGTLKIENKTTIRCTRHSNQTYDKNGITNRARTRKSLEKITLNIKSA